MLCVVLEETLFNAGLSEGYEKLSWAQWDP